MTTVRILHHGGVGPYKKGDIVEDAHVGLVEIAQNQHRNAADGQLLAEIIDEQIDEELTALREEAKALGVKGNIDKMKRETLEAKIVEAKAGA